MASHLLLQIIYPNGEVVRLPGGGNPPQQGTMEADLVKLLVDEIRSNNTLGFSRRKTDEQSIIDALQQFKDLTLKVMV